jgi:hypothetical protein
MSEEGEAASANRGLVPALLVGPGLAIAVLLSSVAACRGAPRRRSPPPAPDALAVERAKKELARAIDAASLTLAPGVSAKLGFEPRSTPDRRVVYGAPAGWTVADGALRPPSHDSADSTAFVVASRCEADCESAHPLTAVAWDALVERRELAPARALGEVAIDEPRTGGAHRIVVLHQRSSPPAARATIVYVWRREGGSRYVVCRADLEGAWAGVADAFEKVCRSTYVLSYE